MNEISAPYLPSVERGHAELQGGTRPATAKKGLPVRFVTRMSVDLSEAVASAAREKGLTSGAFVRRMLLDHVGMQSACDARSSRPIRRPEEDLATIASAIRSLATVSAAISVNDATTAKDGLQKARALLVPLVVRRVSA